ncbi:putative cysteine-rich PDZ-binding protein [Paratrimastix pyriformis]|uniref:Cysteine-rich PDZ-binding protein n=1 Tax=Paratrimastix pyriformis TaxID=342808 RepID=A0ABQ8UCH9_9EUKA|nr:putative cysteine-rich PDZ-binding protein [Paratrimastix pyriformis]
MVCEKCEAKLRSVAAPERWREGSRNIAGQGRRIGGNKLAERRFVPINAHCIVCHAQLSQNYKYCQFCAYKNGLCAMCGARILDTRPYKQISR